MTRSQLSRRGNTDGRRSRQSDAEVRRWLIGAFAGVLLGASSLCSAAVLTVGVHGTYSTIDAAIDAALGAGSTEIRVEQGTYVENIGFGPAFVSDDIAITGGWNATFSTRSSDASLTVIDGWQLDDPVVYIMAGGGSVLVDGFTLTNGTEVIGAGIQVRPSGDAEVTVSNNRIIGNTSIGPSIPAGAGVYFRQFSGSGRFHLVDNLISGNTVENTGGGSASGGGIELYAHDASSFIATGNRIIDNTCVAPMAKVFGCGANLYHDSTGTSEFNDNLIKGNRTVTAAGSDVEGAGGSHGLGQNGNTFIARRNLWIDNRDTGSQEGYHVKFHTNQTGTLTASDTVVAGGPEVGVGMWSYDTSILRLTNMTVFDHPSLGVHFRGFGAETTLFNTIIFGSPTPLDASGSSVSTGGNLLGIDPMFVSPVRWDCRLRTGSPALDSGDNSPPGGLGPSDPDGNPRVFNGVVDIGAYEGVAAFFEDGFESGNTSGWSVVVP